jgi:hypothetical protein
MDFFMVHQLLDTPLQETSKVYRKGVFLLKIMAADPLV